MGRWEKHESDVIPWRVRHEPGVYAIYVEGDLSYIGQSIDIAKRLSGHVNFARYSDWIETPWGRFKDVFVKVSYSKKYGDWAMRELRLIKSIRPKFNCAYSIRPRGTL